MTKAQTLTNIELPEALEVVNKARRRLDYVSPCQENPAAWDGPTRYEADNQHELTDRVVESIVACGTCLVQVECTQVLNAVLAKATDDFVDVEGIIAGEWVMRTTTGANVSHFLEHGSLPEPKEW